MTMRTQLKAGRAGSGDNHNETLKVRTALKAGGKDLNHNEALQVRTALKAGGIKLPNHNETVRREDKAPAASMRKRTRTTGSTQDRLELLIVRAGLRAGRVARERSRGRW